MRYYGLDLRRELLVRSPRSLAALVVGLPPDSNVVRVDEPWSPVEQLLAYGLEQSDLWGRAAALGLGFKANDLPKPPNLNWPKRQSQKTNGTIAAFQKLLTQQT